MPLGRRTGRWTQGTGRGLEVEGADWLVGYVVVLHGAGDEGADEVGHAEGPSGGLLSP